MEEAAGLRSTLNARRPWTLRAIQVCLAGHLISWVIVLLGALESRYLIRGPSMKTWSDWGENIAIGEQLVFSEVSVNGLTRSLHLRWTSSETLDAGYLSLEALPPIRSIPLRLRLSAVDPTPRITLARTISPAHREVSRSVHHLGLGWPTVQLILSDEPILQYANRVIVSGIFHESELEATAPVTRGIGPRQAGASVELPPAGLAINTLFYGSLTLLALRARESLNAWRARRRESCRSCGYPTRGLSSAAACPECGTSRFAPNTPPPPNTEI